MSVRAYLEQVRQRAVDAEQSLIHGLYAMPQLTGLATGDVPRLVAMLTAAVEALQSIDDLKYSSSMKHISEQATKIAAEVLAVLDALSQETP